MTFFKITQILSHRTRSTWSRFVIVPLKDQFRFSSTYKGLRRTKPSVFMVLSLASASALGYSFYKSKEKKFPSLEDICNFFVPTVSASSLSSNDISQYRYKYNFIADVVDVCMPAVVSIERIKSRNRRTSSPPFTNRGVLLNGGSGLIVSEDGLILTNAHVVSKSFNDEIVVHLNDGTTHNAVVEAMDNQHDLAILRIAKKNLPVIKLGDSESLRAGEFVVAIGSPLFLKNTVTTGVVSCSNRKSEEIGMRNNLSYIQTDAAITFGNSGGPLVNISGEVIGINVMNASSLISFAIPVNYAKEFLQKAEKSRGHVVSTEEGKKGEFRRGSPFLGVTMVSINPGTYLQHFGQKLNSRNIENGVLIWSVMEDSPAERAGLQSSDIIIKVNSKKARSVKDIYEVLDKDGPLSLEVLRNGQILQFKVNPERNYNVL